MGCGECGKKTKDTREKNIFSVEVELTTADEQVYKSYRDCHHNRATCSVLLKLPDSKREHYYIEVDVKNTPESDELKAFFDKAIGAGIANADSETNNKLIK